MSVAGTVLVGAQGLLGLAEVAAGGSKVAGAESQVETFDHLGYPQWFRLVTGGLELLAGAGLLASLLVGPTLAFGGSLLAAVILVGALGSHVRAGDPLREMVPAAVLLVLALAVGWNHLGMVL